MAKENKLNLERFNPTASELKKLVEEVKDVSVSDLHNTSEVKEVGVARRKLVTARTTIQKMGKEIRSDAVAFQKAVLAHEKKLISIIAPEEARLKEIEAASKEHLEKLDRKKKLPERHEKLDKLNVVLSDDALLNMNDKEFDEFYTKSLEQMVRKDPPTLEYTESDSLPSEMVKPIMETGMMTEKEIVEKYRKELDIAGYNPITDMIKYERNTIMIYRLVSQIELLKVND